MPLSTTGSARRWTAIAGIAFFVLFIAGWLFSAPDVPDTDAPLADWTAWLNDKGRLSLFSAYLLVLAALCLVVFGIGVALRIRAAKGEGTLTAPMVLGLSAMTGVLIAAGGIALNSPPILYLFEDKAPDPVDVAAILQLQTVGYGLGLVGAMLAAASVIAAATVGLRGTVPGWFTVLGYVCAVLLLGSIIFLPMAALPIWVLIASILFLRGERSRPERAPV
jgi:hypothetical protein